MRIRLEPEERQGDFCPSIVPHLMELRCLGVEHDGDALMANLNRVFHVQSEHRFSESVWHFMLSHNTNALRAFRLFMYSHNARNRKILGRFYVQP